MSSAPSARRVVITGLGLLAPEGSGREQVLEHIHQGRSGIVRTSRYVATATPGHLGGEVADFTDESAKKVYLKEHRKHLKVMGRDVQIGVAAALLAVADAGLDKVEHDAERIGVEFGANSMYSFPEHLYPAASTCVEPPGDTRFRFEMWGTNGLAAMEPLWMLKHLPNMPACHVGIFTNSRGPNNSITNDEVSSNLALGEAAAIIRRGHADVMITGSTGVRAHPLKEVHAMMWDEIGYDPEHPSKSVKPFDVRRNGNAIAEAAACLTLEDEEFARKRNAKIWGALLGSGSSCVADPTGKPDIRRAVANAMRSALRSAGLQPKDVGHVNAHGLASKELDPQEALAIHDVFGELGSKVPVVGLKGYHGNPGAAGGMLELAMSLMSLQEGLIPYTLNCEQPDPALKLNVVTGEPRATGNKVVLNVSYTLIGQASAVVVRAE
jgi:3-oxoacyl-[acyl-carrier-protein] synthase II